jgi:hypothetical protein
MKPMALLSVVIVICLSGEACLGHGWNLSLRRSALDYNTLQKPASIQATFPDSGEASYAMDAGLSVYVPVRKILGSVWDISGSAEYHRNTEIKQDSYAFALSALVAVGDVFRSRYHWGLLPQATASYTVDRAEQRKEFIGRLDAGIVVLQRRWFCPVEMGVIIGPDEFGFLLQPRVGIEYGRVFDADDGPTGDRFRWLAISDAAFYPVGSVLEDRLEASATWNLWQDIAEDKALDGGKHSYVLQVYSVRYYLAKHGEDAPRKEGSGGKTAKVINMDIAIAIEHVHGTNPDQGLQDGEFTRIALEAKY